MQRPAAATKNHRSQPGPGQAKSSRDSHVKAVQWKAWRKGPLPCQPERTPCKPASQQASRHPSASLDAQHRSREFRRVAETLCLPDGPPELIYRTGVRTCMRNHVITAFNTLGVPWSRVNDGITRPKSRVPSENRSKSLAGGGEVISCIPTLCSSSGKSLRPVLPFAHFERTCLSRTLNG